MEIPKIAWILGVGIPSYFLIYLGLLNLDLPLPDFSYGITLSFESALLAIGVGVIASYGLFFHYTNRSSEHGRHCEYTSFAEFFLIVALIILSLNIMFGFFFEPFENEIEYIIIFGIGAIAGGIGVILYRLENDKKILPF